MARSSRTPPRDEQYSRDGHVTQHRGNSEVGLLFGAMDHGVARRAGANRSWRRPGRRQPSSQRPHLATRKVSFIPSAQNSRWRRASRNAEKDVVANHAGADLGRDIGEAKGPRVRSVDAGSANFNRAVGGEGGAARAGLQAEGAPELRGHGNQGGPSVEQEAHRLAVDLARDDAGWPARLRCRTSWLAPAATTRLRLGSWRSCRHR